MMTPVTHRFQTFEPDQPYFINSSGDNILHIAALQRHHQQQQEVREDHPHHHQQQESLESIPAAQEISTSESSSASPARHLVKTLYPTNSNNRMVTTSPRSATTAGGVVSAWNAARGGGGGSPAVIQPSPPSSAKLNRNSLSSGAAAAAASTPANEITSMVSDEPFDQRLEQQHQQHVGAAHRMVSAYIPNNNSNPTPQRNKKACTSGGTPPSRPFDEAGQDEEVVLEPADVEENYHLQSDDNRATDAGGALGRSGPLPPPPHQNHHQQQQQHNQHQYQHQTMQQQVNTFAGSNQGLRNYHSDSGDVGGDVGGGEPYDASLRMPPPRVSDPMLFPYESEYAAGDRQRIQPPPNLHRMDHQFLHGEETATEASIDGNIEETTVDRNSEVGGGGGRQDAPSYEEFDIQQQQLGLNTAHHRVLRELDSDPTTTTSKKEEDEETEDSIFDFDERDGKRVLRSKHQRKSGVGTSATNSSSSNNRRRGRGGAEEVDDADDDDDDDDADSYEVRVSLTERAQAAWKRKSARRKQAGGESHNSRGRASTTKPPTPPSNHAVSFNKNNDVVHTFAPDETTQMDETFAGRSLNSEYTKSAESEVEDFIKDIFMLGNGTGNNPGRRKLKYSPHVKEKLRHDRGQGEQYRRSSGSGTDEETNETNETNETDDYHDDEEEDDDEEDFVADSATPGSSKQRGKKQYSKRNRHASGTGNSSSRLLVDEKKDDDDDDPLSNVWDYMEVGVNAVGAALGLDEDGNPDNSCGNRPVEECGGGGGAQPSSKSRHMSSRGAPSSEGKGGMNCIFQYASDFILGAGSGSSCEVDLPLGSGGDQDIIKSAPSLEEDVRLVDLAMQAARSMHKLRGYEFDESYDINIVSDIKFCVVDLNLPLGLIFQENETGCWVTKVLPEGHAIQTGLVEVGDQLAAVDGVSAIHMKVDQISKIIKRKSEDIELTFLRYVGPLRPAAGTIAEEGYEIKASDKAKASTNGNATKSNNKRAGFLGIRKVAMGIKNNGAASRTTDVKSKSTQSVRSPVTAASSRQTAKSSAAPEKKRGLRNIFGRKKTK